jgi:hypothetical protein
MAVPGLAERGGSHTGLLPGPEYEGIATLRHLHQDRFIPAFLGEVLQELLAKLGSLNADERILTCVVVRGTAEDEDADLVFSDGGIGAIDAAGSDKQEQLSQTIGLLEDLAGGDPLQEQPPGVTGSGAWLRLSSLL